MHNGRNQIRYGLSKPNHTKKRSSSYAPKPKTTPMLNPKNTIEKIAISPLSLISLQEQREKRKLEFCSSSKSKLQLISTPLERNLSPESDKIRTIEKQWEQVKKTIDERKEAKSFYKSSSNLKSMIDSTSQPFSPASMISFNNESPVQNLISIEEIYNRSEPHAQNVKQFTIKENYIQMQSKHFVPVTTINLGAIEQLNGVKSFSGSEQKSTENSTVEKISDSTGKIRNRSYEPSERKKKEEGYLTKVKSKCLLNYHKVFVNNNQKKVSPPKKKGNKKEAQPNGNKELMKVTLSKINVNSCSLRKIKDYLDSKIRERGSRVSDR